MSMQSMEQMAAPMGKAWQVAVPIKREKRTGRREWWEMLLLYAAVMAVMLVAGFALAGQ